MGWDIENEREIMRLKSDKRADRRNGYQERREREREYT